MDADAKFAGNFAARESAFNQGQYLYLAMAQNFIVGCVGECLAIACERVYHHAFGGEIRSRRCVEAYGISHGVARIFISVIHSVQHIDSPVATEIEPQMCDEIIQMTFVARDAADVVEEAHFGKIFFFTFLFAHQ